ncbi:MAG: type III polyketide synthase [Planctomycetota bacterium]|nr:MAG: type III polyketide synthase [Planctomycetota bacterium]
MTFLIQGLGTAIPERSMTQELAAEHSVEMWGETHGRAGVVRALYRRSGVKRRHSVLIEPADDPLIIHQSFYDRSVGTLDRGPTTSQRMQRYEVESIRLGTRSCTVALESAGIAASEITHLVTVSCSGFSAPGLDIGLIEKLGLNREVTRTNVGFMGCHGAFNGLRVAKAYAESDPEACVLLCCVEICSLHQQYTGDAQQIVANALFSDGSAAVVGRASEKGAWQLRSQRSLVLEETLDHMTWRVGDHGFEMSLSPQVPDIIGEHLRSWVEGWLRPFGLSVEQIPTWAIHPGGPRILSACTAALGIDDAHADISREVLSQNGNMSSPTILFILDQLRKRQAPLPCVALAFGPGLTIEAALWI